MTARLVSRTVAVWLVIMAAESLHGVARRLYLEPALGQPAANQAGVLIGALIVLALAWAFAGWLRWPNARAALISGGVWVVLTVVFEVSLGLALGYGGARIAADYDPSRGGLMLLGLAAMFVTPLVVRRLRRPPGGQAGA